MPYSKLLLATGASPIRLPDEIGSALNGVFCMRDLADAVAVGLGMQVVLVEAADRILQRVASAETSDYFRLLHQDHGVEIREGVMLDQLKEIDGTVSGAVLSDGSSIDVDIVIAGIGIRPNQELAVDAFCRTSEPDIFAAGDCASFPHGSSRIRLESVGNAIDQAETAAASIAGNPLPYLAIALVLV